MIMNKILLNINSEIKDLRMKKQSSMVEDLGIYLSDKANNTRRKKYERIY